MTGERLGTIGQPEKEATMPDWQKALSSKPSVSVRKGIARVSYGGENLMPFLWIVLNFSL